MSTTEPDVPPPPDLREGLRRLTDARVMLPRAGVAQTTAAELAFRLDHARARDAVLWPFDAPAMAEALRGVGVPSAVVASRAADRATYVRRPDLGRFPAEGFEAALGFLPKARDVAFLVADGLSATAVGLNAVPLIEALRLALARRGIGVGGAAVAANGRVALGDWVGQALAARVVVVLIGERPGLSAADSLGAYVTFAPVPGLPDSRRNCVSNIRARGLPAAAAAERIAALVAAMLACRTSGTLLPEPNASAVPLVASWQD